MRISLNDKNLMDVLNEIHPDRLELEFNRLVHTLKTAITRYIKNINNDNRTYEIVYESTNWTMYIDIEYRQDLKLPMVTISFVHKLNKNISEAQLYTEYIEYLKKLCDEIATII